MWYCSSNNCFQTLLYICIIPINLLTDIYNELLNYTWVLFYKYNILLHINNFIQNKYFTKKKCIVLQSDSNN